jgi:hypothetical protein
MDDLPETTWAISASKAEILTPSSDGLSTSRGEEVPEAALRRELKDGWERIELNESSRSSLADSNASKLWESKHNGNDYFIHSSKD